MSEGRNPLDGDNTFINSVTNFKTIKIMYPVIWNIQDTGHPGMGRKKAEMGDQHQNPCAGQSITKPAPGKSPIGNQVPEQNQKRHETAQVEPRRNLLGDKSNVAVIAKNVFSGGNDDERVKG